MPRTLIGDIVSATARDVRVLAIADARNFRYESVYFDTADLLSYLGAARRRPRRFKVRTRSYLDSGDCLLEVKVRGQRGRTVKHRRPHELESRAELTDAGRRFVRSIEASAAVVDQRGPVLTTAYRRATFVLSDNAGARDHGRRSELATPRQWPGPATRAGAHRDQDCGTPCEFDRALWRFGHRPVTISKYCTGLAALQRHVPANKWNRVLRRHFEWQGPEGG